jgi:hypothetical protein
MQAAANRSPAPKGVRCGPRWPETASVRRRTIAALLAALPIAAAIVGLTSKGALKLIERNSRFDEAIAHRPDEAMIDAAIAATASTSDRELMTAFLADAAGRRARFPRRRGVAARYFRIKLAPLPRDDGSGRRAACSAWSTARSRCRPSGRCAPKCCATA